MRDAILMHLVNYFLGVKLEQLVKNVFILIGIQIQAQSSKTLHRHHNIFSGTLSTVSLI